MSPLSIFLPWLPVPTCIRFKSSDIHLQSGQLNSTVQPKHHHLGPQWPPALHQGTCLVLPTPHTEMPQRKLFSSAVLRWWNELVAQLSSLTPNKCKHATFVVGFNAAARLSYYIS